MSVDETLYAFDFYVFSLRTFYTNMVGANTHKKKYPS